MTHLTLSTDVPASGGLRSWIRGLLARPAAAPAAKPAHHEAADPFCFDAPPALAGTFDACRERLG